MAVITQRDSGKWQAKVRRQGWPTQSKSFRTKADALAWSRAVEREMDVGSFIQRDDAERTTFAQAADRYRREVLPTKRGAAQDEYVLKRVVERFGKYSMAAISPTLIAAYRDERLSAVAPQTVVHELGMISRVFRAATMDWGIALPQGLPTALVRKPSISNERTRRLEPGEEDMLLETLEECANPWPKAAAILAIETAARQSELLALQWNDIDLGRRVARVRGKDGGVTKSGDTFRDVPLSRRAVETLAALRDGSPKKGQVLPTTQNALQLSWERACSRARTRHLHERLREELKRSGAADDIVDREIRALVYKKRPAATATIELFARIENDDTLLKDLRFHDLRHEATSRLAEKLAMHELMKVTGHKTSRMVARYYHPRAEQLAAKLD